MSIEKYKWSKIAIQGLSGMGLVGFNISRSFLANDDSKKIIIEDFSEFFPNIAVITDGRIKNQALELVKVVISPNKDIIVINGGQPHSDELAAAFMYKFKTVLEKISEIELYLSFGAMVKNFDLPKEEAISNRTEKDIENLAINLLLEEEKKERMLYIATAGNITYEEFHSRCLELNASASRHLVKENESYITGLNGTLPAYIGQVLHIPVVTIMIETALPEWANANSPLTQYLGILASISGLNFLIDFLGIEKNAIALLTDTAEKMRPLAITQLAKSMLSEQLPAQSNHERMYV